MTATSTPLHRDRSPIVIETELRIDDGKLVGTTTQARSVLHPRPNP